MSVSKLSNRWLNRLYKSIAIFLVTFAVLISAMRLLLPYVQHYRVELQTEINQRYQTDIRIGNLTTDWLKFGPVLVAEHVDLINTDSAKVSVGRISMEVDFWRSLRQQKFNTNYINIDDAYIYIDKEKWLESNQSDSNTEQSASIKNVSDLFLSQISRFSLSNSHVTLNDSGQEKNFTISHLNWLNKSNRHQASGDVILEELTNDKLKLLIDLNGSEFEKLAGQIYLQAKNLNITPWLDTVLKVEQENIKSDINFDAWANIKKGRTKDIQFAFLPSTLKWSSNNQEKSLSLNKGSLLFQKVSDQSFDIQSSPISLSVDQKALKPISLDARVDLEQGAFLYVSDIDVAGIANIVPIFSDDTDTLKLLNAMRPKGSINDIYWRTENNVHQVSAIFNQISIQNVGGIPGLTNLTGEVTLNGNHFFGKFNALDSALDFGENFKQPLAFNRLTALFDGHVDGDGVIFNAPIITFKSNALDASAELGLTLLNETAPNMSLLAQIHRANVVQINQYYPHLLMGEDLVSYLDGALISGQIEQAQVLFNGPLNAFPFAQHEGIFVADAELVKARFEFDDLWPDITSFSSNLNFTNNGMLITAREGRLSGLDIRGVTARIDDLDEEQLLIVNAGLDKQLPENITTLMQASPLRDSVGETLTQLTISQPVSGSFKLELPLNDVVSAVASGKIQFVNNDLDLQTPEMQFSQVNGELSFINDVLEAKDISLNWLDMPLTINVMGQDKTNHYQTDISMSAQWQESDWQIYVPETLQKYAAGEVSWTGELSLNSHHDSGFSYDLIVNSNLKNTVFELPEPYKKDRLTESELTAKVNGREQESTLHVSLDENLSFYGVLNHENVQFTKAHLVLGNEQMLLPMNGFHITTKLDQAELSTWQPLVMDILNSLPESSEDSIPLIESPERIRGTIAQFDVFGQGFNNLSFNLLDQTNWWLLQVNAKEIRSQIKFYPDWRQQGIDVDADFIKLVAEAPKELPIDDDSAPSSDVPEDVNIQDLSEYIASQKVESAEETKAIFEGIPTIKFQCDSCQFYQLDLGEMSFTIDRIEDNKLSLNNLKSKRDKSEFSMDGSWQFDPQGESETSLTGKLSTKDVEQEVEKLGYASLIKDSGLKTDFNLNWQGGPHEFNFPKLSGDIAVEFDEGYLAEVSDNGARIFAILSLQSLLRKLTLDFRDVFSDGMFYSSIKGDMQVKDGVLYTNNTRMKGAAGDLSIKGNTDLVKGLLDYRMSYKPNLTSSLPVLAWIATLNPVVFLTGIAIDEVITSKVVSEFNFELTGAVDDPQLKEVNRKTRDVSVGRSAPPQFVENNPNKSEIDPASIKDDNPAPNGTEDKQDKSDG